MKKENEKPPVDPNVALNGAANLILSMLSEPVRELLMETAAVTLNIPLWQLVAGVVQQSYDIGLYTTPVLDPDWLRNLPARPQMFDRARCKQCGETFEPRWLKQEFCGNECGTKHQLAIARNRLRGHVVGGKHPLGQEPKGAVSSAIRPADAD